MTLVNLKAVPFKLFNVLTHKSIRAFDLISRAPQKICQSGHSRPAYAHEENLLSLFKLKHSVTFNRFYLYYDF